MARPVIDKEVFETERNVVKEELRQRRARAALRPAVQLRDRRECLQRPAAPPADDRQHRRPRHGHAGGRARLPRSLLRPRHRDPDRRPAISSRRSWTRWSTNISPPCPSAPTAIPLAIKTKDTPLDGRAGHRDRPNVPLPIVGSTWQTPGAASRDMARDGSDRRHPHPRRQQPPQTALVKPGLPTQAARTSSTTRKNRAIIALMAIVASGRASRRSSRPSSTRRLKRLRAGPDRGAS